MARSEECVEKIIRVNASQHKVGLHVILEFNGVDPKKLNNLRFCRESLKEAAIAAGAKIVFVRFHHFNPQGVTGVVGVEESHLSVHTWPEHGFAAIDIFLCLNESGEKINPQAAIQVMSVRFQPKFTRLIKISRGPEKKFIAPA